MTERRYRIITVVLEETVSFEEAQATLRAIRHLRGVSEVHLNQAPGELERAGQPAEQVDPTALEP